MDLFCVSTCLVGFILSVYQTAAVPHNQKATGAEKCMTDLGCFPVSADFFHPLYRPVNRPPSDRENINTKFTVYTRNHPKTPFQIRAKNKTSLEKSTFDASKKTKIIVHGWIDNHLFADWMKEMKDEYLLNGDHNVILVDWSGGNGPPYMQAVANTRVAGAEIAFLLNWLNETEGAKLEDCHILGHSLGSHVAGYAGERLKNLGRITGMDPAEPYFQYMPPTVRLDPTDADFVDVIHTDSLSIFAGGLGMSQLVGHVDFFPNAGYKQPGCEKDKIFDFVTEGLIGGARAFIACNHQRAVVYAQHSINHHQCVFTGYNCPDWENFLDGKCASCGVKGDLCAQMGDKAPEHYAAFKNDSRQLAFYLKTGPSSPFCVFQYQVTISLKANDGKDQEGKLSLTLRGEESEETFKLGNGEKIKLYHGASYTYYIWTKTDLGPLVSATFSWTNGQLLPWPKRILYLKGIKIIPMNVIEKSSRASLTRNYCAGDKDAVENKKEITFYEANKC